MRLDAYNIPPQNPVQLKQKAEIPPTLQDIDTFLKTSNLKVNGIDTDGNDGISYRELADAYSYLQIILHVMIINQESPLNNKEIRLGNDIIKIQPNVANLTELPIIVINDKKISLKSLNLSEQRLKDFSNFLKQP